MDASHIAMTAAGALLLAFFLWSRTPRGAGWWYPPRSLNMPRLVFLVGPCFAVVMVLAGLSPAVRDTPALRAVSTLVIVAALVVAVVGVFTKVPGWATPAWARPTATPASGRDGKELHGGR